MVNFNLGSQQEPFKNVVCYMPLTLKVLTLKGQPVSPSTVVHIDNSGTIGRSDNNTLVLPDSEKFVSRQHATIAMENGLYYLTDASLGGVLITGQEYPLHNSTQQIVNGMVLKIGEYEIGVSIDDVPLVEDFPFANPETDYFLTTNNCGENRLMQDSSAVRHEELIQTSGEDFVPVFESQLQGSSSVLFDSFIAPEIATNPFAVEAIPENFSFEDLLAEHTPPQPALAPTTAIVQKRPEPLSALPNDALFTAFLRGAGIEYRSSRPELLPEIMVRVGQMFRHLITGTVALLRTRTAFKSLFRMDMTIIEAANNNPLKFTVNTDDVIRQFLDNKTEGFLGSIEAIDQGFDDMIIHQQAMQAGIEAAVAELVKSFDPKLIEKQIEQGIVLQKKAKCWDKYEEIYRHAETGAMENFFSTAFADAYEAKIRQLIAKRQHHR